MNHCAYCEYRKHYQKKIWTWNPGHHLRKRSVLSVCIGNHMVLSAIWDKSTWITFSKSNHIEWGCRVSAICSLRKFYEHWFFQNAQDKSCDCLLIMYMQKCDSFSSYHVYSVSWLTSPAYMYISVIGWKMRTLIDMLPLVETYRPKQNKFSLKLSPIVLSHFHDFQSIHFIIISALFEINWRILNRSRCCLSLV